MICITWSYGFLSSYLIIKIICFISNFNTPSAWAPNPPALRHRKMIMCLENVQTGCNILSFIQFIHQETSLSLQSAFFPLYILHISARGIWGNHAKLCDLGHTNNARTSLDLNVANFDCIEAKGQLRARHPHCELAAASEPCCKHSGGNVRHETIRWIYAAIRLRDSGRRLNNQVIMLPLSTLTKVQGGHTGQWG